MEWNFGILKPIILGFLTIMLLKHNFEKYTNIAFAIFLLKQLISDNVVKAENKLSCCVVFHVLCRLVIHRK